MTTVPTGTAEIIALIAHYSDTLDLVEAEHAAHAALVAEITDYPEFNPVELKIVMEQGVQARFDVVVAIVVALLAEVQNWPVDTHDQERQALKDTLRLIKHHTELELIRSFKQMREVEDGNG